MKIKSILCALGALGCSSVLWAQAEGWCPDNGDGTFTNPILWGDWPDPDVIRVGDDFTWFLLVCIMFREVRF